MLFLLPARSMILVSMLVSALLVLVLGGLGELLFPRQTGRIVVRGRPVQCYREMLAGVPGKDEAFCTTRPGQCSPVGCPAQGPSTIGWAIGAHPLLLLLGLLAILYREAQPRGLGQAKRFVPVWMNAVFSAK